MTPKKVAHSSTPELDPSEKKAFWEVEPLAPLPAADQARHNLSEHISRLQQRQMELVQQTALELEEIKRQIEENREYEMRVAEATAPLQHEVSQLRQTVKQLEEEKQLLRQELNQTAQTLQSHYAHVEGVLNNLRSSVPTPELSTVPTPPAPVQHPVFEEHVAKLVQEHHQVHEQAAPRKARRLPIGRRFATRAVSLAVVAGAAAWGVNTLHHKQITPVDAGQVAGVSTQAPAASATAAASDTTSDLDRPEINADVAFADTQWGTFQDTDFNMSMLYPNNSTVRVRVVGSDNVFFPRKDHILAKITKYDTPATLDQWWSNNSSQFTDTYTAVKSVFKNKQAYVLTPITNDNLAGTEYIVKSGDQILAIWLHNEANPKSDDGQRIAKMVESIVFTN